MKKILFSLVAVLSALTMMAQTPTVSTSSITLRYCTTKLGTTDTTINKDALPFIWDGDTIPAKGTYERLYTAADGCDSIATLKLKTIKLNKYKLISKNGYISNEDYNVLPEVMKDKMEYNSDWGEYSAKEDIYIVIAAGNLQYQASTKKFRIAAHGYDYVGNAPGNTTEESARSNQSDWIDLFGYGTSGYNDHYPYWCQYSYSYGSSNNPYYYANPSSNVNNYDWCSYNAIVNEDAVDPAGTWFTPTYWIMDKALAYAKTNNKLGAGVINGVKGFIILPEEWEAPSGVPLFQPYALIQGSVLVPWKNATKNTYTVEEWDIMASEGAIFLPAEDGGFRLENTVGGYSPISTYDGDKNGSIYWVRDHLYRGISYNNYGGWTKPYVLLLSTSYTRQGEIDDEYVDYLSMYGKYSMDAYRGGYVRPVKLYDGK